MEIRGNIWSVSDLSRIGDLRRKVRDFERGLVLDCYRPGRRNLCRFDVSGLYQQPLSDYMPISEAEAWWKGFVTRSEFDEDIAPRVSGNVFE